MNDPFSYEDQPVTENVRYYYYATGMDVIDGTESAASDVVDRAIWTETITLYVTAAPTNGATVFAMRHANRLNRLGRPADQRKALVRSLVTEVLRHGRITTTKTKAKAIRKYVDKMIGLAKDGSLHARRQAAASGKRQSGRAPASGRGKRARPARPAAHARATRPWGGSPARRCAPATGRRCARRSSG
jgi:hypothetical protein